MSQHEKYWALRLMATINAVIGWILIVFGIATAGIGAAGGPNGATGGIGIAAGLGCALLGTAWVAGSQLIYVLIDIEKNTRLARTVGEEQAPGLGPGGATMDGLCLNCGHAYSFHVDSDGIRAVPCESGNCGCTQFAAF